MSFTMDDVMQALQIVKECKDVALNIDTGDMKLSLLKGNVAEISRPMTDLSNTFCLQQTEPAATPPAATVRQAEPAAMTISAAEPAREELPVPGLVAVKATMTSVFYRRPSPDEPPFVEVGDEVEKDTVVCLLEVMKCFRQVTADIRGRIEKICAESNSMVEKETVLFWIKPA